MKIARVKFKDTMKLYDFKTDLDLEIGDIVVCDTQYGYALADVKKVLDSSTTNPSKWIVCKVDNTAHAQRLEKDKKMEEIKSKLEARKKQLEEITIYQILAKQDDEMKKLLDEYNAIGGN